MVEKQESFYIKLTNKEGLKLIREIEYIVSESGISPATKQFGGIQGEHNATKLIFKFDEELRAKLTNLDRSEERIHLRFDGYDAEGRKFEYAPFKWGSNSYEFLIPHDLTKNGGVIKVVLVVTVDGGEGNGEIYTEIELYSFPAVLKLESQPDGKTTDSEDFESLTTLALRAEEAAASAESDAKTAANGAERTEAAKAALQGGTVWIFDGGNAAGDVDLNGDGEPDINTADVIFVIDNELSAEKNNAISNKAVKSEFDKVREELRKLSNDVLGWLEILEANIKAAAKLDAHPIGSLYFSSNSQNPGVIFGGTWEQIKDKFILAAGDTYKAGGSGGTAEVTLTTEQIPSHYHNSYGWASITDPSGDYIVLGSNLINGSDDSDYRTRNTGGGQPHNNMPPYETYYCWKRTA